MNAKPQPKTAAEIGARISAIGAALAANGGLPVPGWRALQDEQEQLVAEYRKQLDRESARPSEETMRQAREHDERQARVAKALSDARR